MGERRATHTSARALYLRPQGASSCSIYLVF
jgi:hypothetical protein